MTEWSKAFKVISLILLVIMFVVIGLVFASKSDLHATFGVNFGIRVEPTPQQIDPFMRSTLP